MEYSPCYTKRYIRFEYNFSKCLVIILVKLLFGNHLQMVLNLKHKKNTKIDSHVVPFINLIFPRYKNINKRKEKFVVVYFYDVLMDFVIFFLNIYENFIYVD